MAWRGDQDWGGLLATLDRAGVRIGPREEIAATLILAELGANGQLNDDANAEAIAARHLKPALAHGEEAARRFDANFPIAWRMLARERPAQAQMASQPHEPPSVFAGPTDTLAPKRHWLMPLAVIAVLAATIVIGMLMWPRGQGPAPPPTPTVTATDPVVARPAEIAPIDTTAPVATAALSADDAAEAARWARLMGQLGYVLTPREVGTAFAQDPSWNGEPGALAAQIGRAVGIGPDDLMEVQVMHEASAAGGASFLAARPAASDIEPLRMRPIRVPPNLPQSIDGEKRQQLDALATTSSSANEAMQALSDNMTGEGNNEANLINRAGTTALMTIWGPIVSTYVDEINLDLLAELPWWRDNGRWLEAAIDAQLTTPMSLDNGARLIVVPGAGWPTAERKAAVRKLAQYVMNAIARHVEVQRLRAKTAPDERIPAHLRTPWLAARDARHAERAPHWIWPAAFTLLTLAALILFIARDFTDRAAYLRRRRPMGAVLSKALEAEAKLPRDKGGVRKAAMKLSTWDRLKTRLIDGERTAIASAERGGFIDPRYVERRAYPEYLFLVQRGGENDIAADRAAEMARQFATQGVRITRYEYRGDPRSVRAPTGGRPIPLGRLAARHPRARVIVVGDASAFIDPTTHALRPWANVFRGWAHRALATGRPRDAWDHAERALAEQAGFHLASATMEGFFQIGGALGQRAAPETARATQAPPRFFSDDPARLLSDRPLSPADADDLAPAAKAWLGLPGYKWLASLAAYPAIQIDLAMHLGARLAHAGEPVFSEETFARLSALPWFKAGHMPDWVRARLLAGLDKQAQADVAGALAELLGALDETDADSTAGARVRLQFAREQQAKRDRLDEADLGVNEDHIFLDFLVRNRATALDTAPPGPLLKRLARLLGAARWRSLRLALAAPLILLAVLLATPGGLHLLTSAWALATGWFTHATPEVARAAPTGGGLALLTLLTGLMLAMLIPVALARGEMRPARASKPAEPKFTPTPKRPNSAAETQAVSQASPSASRVKM